MFHQNAFTVLLLVYVDDLLLTGNNPTIVNQLISTLSNECSIKDLGYLHFFLGIEARYFLEGIILTQTKYTHDLFTQANMIEVTPIKTPMATKLTAQNNDHLQVDPTKYTRLVRSLQYLTFTHPNIVHAVSRVCQHFQAPTMLYLSQKNPSLPQRHHGLWPTLSSPKFLTSIRV